MKHNILLLFFLNFCALLSAQFETRKAEIFDAISANIDEDIENSDKLLQIEENLLHFSENKLDINQATKEDFEKLYFLSATQIEELHAYIYKYGPIKSIYELQLIRNFSLQDCHNLEPFVTVNPTMKTEKFDWKKSWKYAKNEILAYSEIIFEEKKGYNSSTKNGYAGNPLKTSFQYKFYLKNKLYFGISAKTDAGESFVWNNKTKGFDSYDIYLQINDFQRFKTIVVGNFKASFGQGLTVGNNFYSSKTSFVTNTQTTSIKLQKSSSQNKFYNFTGLGTTVTLPKNLELTAFYSLKSLDGTINNNQFTSFKTSGLHRTVNEISAKNNILTQSAAVNLTFNRNNFKIGTTFLSTWFNYLLKPTPTIYNKFYFSGYEQFTGSIDYQFRWKKIYFFGETALCQNLGIATVNGFHFSPLSFCNFSILYRYYSEKYNALYANSFGEQTKTNNEEGIYLGIQINPFPHWEFYSYTDIFRSLWLSSSTYKPTTGYDAMFQTNFYPNTHTNMLWKIRYIQKEKNITAENSIIKPIGKYQKASLQYKINYDFRLKHFSFSNKIEGNISKYETQNSTYGFLISQNINYAFTEKLKTNLRYEYFFITNYENRIYTYENDVLYKFNNPSVYGKGHRWYINLSCKITKNINVYFKISQTIFTDRTIISSGLEEINKPHKTDFSLLLRGSF